MQAAMVGNLLVLGVAYVGYRAGDEELQDMTEVIYRNIDLYMYVCVYVCVYIYIYIYIYRCMGVAYVGYRAGDE